ncbi:MAG: hypothetical protein L7F77_02925 [Candidatus Magnetominusculus sp. LBB02]|nr:hypothetical protein [Candidatus Magnetominusculus sp. LBB02]
MEGTTSFFESLLKVQKEFISNWVQTATDMSKNFQAMAMPKDSTGGNVMDLYNVWFKTVGGSVDEMMRRYPSGLGKDTVTKVFQGFDSYMKVYEFWQPVISAIQDNASNPDYIKDMVDPVKLKGLIDKLFGFTSPESASEMFGQSTKVIETWGAAAQNFASPWFNAVQKSMSGFLDQSAAKDPNAAIGVFNNFYNAFEQTFGKVFKSPQVGKDREKQELMLRTMDLYSVYIAKNAEFQHKIYVAGEKGSKKVVEALADKIKAGEEIKSYNDFYKMWTDINEAEYFQLFNTDEFSVIQGALLESALDFRKHFHKLLELYLSDFPIPVRSEMDDMYKTLYELKRKVRVLEKKLNVKQDKEVAQ